MGRLTRRLSALPWRKVGAFSLLQIGAGVVPLLVLPVITRLVGASGWVALSIGFAVGAVVALVINFGWPLRGPALVAGAEVRVAQAIYWESVCFRCIVAVPALIIGAAVSLLLSPKEFGDLAALMTVGTGLNGLAATWYFIGRAKPSRIATTDLAPKVVASGCSIVLLMLTGAAWTYPVMMIIAALLSPTIANLLVLGRLWQHWPSRARLLCHGRDQAPLVASGLILTGYGAFAIPLASIAGASIAAMASFAAAVRLRSMVQTGLSAVTSGFQGWAIESVDGRRRPRRMIAALVANTSTGLVAAIGFAFFAPFITPILLGPEVHLSVQAALNAGGACLFYSMSASLSYHILAPFDRLKWIAVSTTVASIVGVPAILILAGPLGAEGATLAVMIAECLVVALQAPVAVRVLQAELRNEREDPAIQAGSAEQSVE